MSLEIATRHTDGVIILELTGKLILGYETSALRDAIKELLAQQRLRVVFDLAKVTLMDSAGVGTLVGAYVSLKRQQGVLKLANTAERFRRTLQVTRLSTVFELYDSTAEAVASFA